LETLFPERRLIITLELDDKEKGILKHALEVYLSDLREEMSRPKIINGNVICTPKKMSSKRFSKN